MFTRPTRHNTDNLELSDKFQFILEKCIFSESIDVLWWWLSDLVTLHNFLQRNLHKKFNWLIPIAGKNWSMILRIITNENFPNIQHLIYFAKTNKEKSFVVST